MKRVFRLVGPMIVVSCLGFAGPSRGEVMRSHFADNIAGHHYPKHRHFQHHDGVTYIVMHAGPDEDPHAWAYDHNRKQWLNGGEGVFIAKNPQDNDDDHGNPSIIVDDAGYVHAFFGGHSHYNNGYQQYYRSVEPGRIDQWQKMDFDTYSTYPMGWTNSDGSISVMYRNGRHHMPGSDPWVIQTSHDHGQTWSAKRKIVQAMSGNSNEDMYAIAVKYPGQDKIGIGISDEYTPGAPRHTTDDLYYVVYDLANNRFENAAGKVIHDGGDGLDHAELLADFHIVDYAALGNTHKRISARPAITAGGKVHVLATNGDPSRFDTDGNYGGLPRFWNWNDDNQQWDAADPGHPVSYWIEADGEALLALTGGDEPWIKKLIRSTDGGATWTDVREIVIPHYDGDPYGALFNDGGRAPHPDAQVIFFERGDGPDNHAYLWGESGFIAVPEPSAMGVLGAGAITLLLRRSHR